MKMRQIKDGNGAFYSSATLIKGTVTIIIAVVVIAVYTGLFSDAEHNNMPMVSIKQERTFVLVTSVRNGPVLVNNTMVKIINKATGTAEGNLTINLRGDWEFNIADTVSVLELSKGAYSVEFIYNDNIIGQCQYNLY